MVKSLGLSGGSSSHKPVKKDANPKQPHSASGSRPPSGPACKFCRRGRGHPNPTPTKREGVWLHFIAVDRAECCSCKAFLQNSYKGQKKEAIAKSLEDEKRHESYMGPLTSWEKDYNDCEGVIRNVAMKYKPPVLLTLEETSSSGGVMNLGVC